MTMHEDRLDGRILPVLEKTLNFFLKHGCAAFVVGGSIRDLLLHHPITDWDIVISDSVPRLAPRLADALEGYYVRMHDKASRVVVKDEHGELILDIAPMHGAAIQDDLLQRDFTLNALAAPLSDVIATLHDSTHALSSVLIDPTHGLADIHTHTLRTVSDTIFQHDPLRLLRAVRFAIYHALSIEPHTEKLIKRDAHLLLQAAASRIHEEMYAILTPASATTHLHLLDRLGLFTILMPEFIAARGMPQPELHHWDVFEHSLETVSALEFLMAQLHLPAEELHQSPLTMNDANDLLTLQTLLREAEGQQILTVASLTSPAMKLAALLHDIGKPVTYVVDEGGNIHFYGHPQAGVPLVQQIMRRINASTHDTRLAQQVAAHHMRPGQLSNTPMTPRAIRRYFLDLGPTGIAVALISLADHLAMRGPEPLLPSWERHLSAVRILLTRYIRERRSILPPRLIQPEEIIHHFGVEPGPLLGQLLEEIAEAQAEGEIRSRSEAFWFLEERLGGKKEEL